MRVGGGPGGEEARGDGDFERVAVRDEVGEGGWDLCMVGGGGRVGGGLEEEDDVLG